jgi:hypothetical protein
MILIFYVIENKGKIKYYNNTFICFSMNVAKKGTNGF